MHSALRSIAIWLFRRGGVGLLILSAYDSSFFSAPVGEDLLMLGLTARRPGHMLYYAAMATGGSLLGCWSVYAITRKAEEGIKKKVPQNKLKFVESQMRRHAGWALAVASLMPPPFPFTAFVAAAAASSYSPKKLFLVLGATRFSRFLIEGLLALHYGRGILRLAESKPFEDTVIALAILSIALSGLTVFQWIRRAKRKQ